MRDDDTIIQFELDPANPPKPDWRAFDSMTEQERHAAALADPDCPPATEAQLARAYRVPNIKTIRRRLNLTQEQFARRFQLSLGAVRDWEQGTHQPDHAARALLRVIAFNPDLVEKALSHEDHAS
jgi:putative transcriptional regulator